MQVILVKKRSIVWGHFIVIEGGGGDFGQLVTIVAQPMLVILSWMSLQPWELTYNHNVWNILIGNTKKKKKNQSTLAFKPKEEGESSGKLVPWVFNFEECKKALA